MASLTDSKGRAKCLAYRNGKRCNRLAHIVGSWQNRQGHHHTALCDECAERLNAKIQQESGKGFTVSVSTFGSVSRTYHSIDKAETEQRDYDECAHVGKLIAKSHQWERGFLAAS